MEGLNWEQGLTLVITEINSVRYSMRKFGKALKEVGLDGSAEKMKEFDLRLFDIAEKIVEAQAQYHTDKWKLKEKSDRAERLMSIVEDRNAS
jgi:hypothetical protein